MASDLVSFGPIFPEVGLKPNQDRDEQMTLHKPLRDQMAGLEKKLRDALVAAEYDVLNVVHSKKQFDDAHWMMVRNAFSEHFPELLDE